MRYLDTYFIFDIFYCLTSFKFQIASTEPFAVQAKETIRVNYFGTRKVCDALFPILRPHARVVNLSSILGHLLRIPAQPLREELSAENLTVNRLDELMNEFVK